MAQIIDGKAVSAAVKQEVADEAAKLRDEKGLKVGLAVVIVGNDSASRVYVNNKKKACEAVGFQSFEYALDENTTQEQLLDLVNVLNRDDRVNGILVIAADGTATEIANKLTNEHKMTVRIEGTKRTAEDKDEIVSALKAIDGIKYVRADMEREKGIYDYDIESDDAIDVRRAINSLCRNKGWNILMLQLSDMTLEDIFMKITTGTMETIKTTDSEEKKNVLDDYNIGVTGGMDINKAEDIEETEGGDE